MICGMLLVAVYVAWCQCCRSLQSMFIQNVSCQFNNITFYVVSGKMVTCPTCGYKGKNTRALRMHMMVAHKESAKVAADGAMGKEDDPLRADSPVIAGESLEQTPTVVTADDYFDLYTADCCGLARSHTEFLERVASQLSGHLVKTLAQGDCFFDAVRIGLAQAPINLPRTIAELRLLAGIELERNAAGYRPLYFTEDHGRGDQAVTYDLYVHRIRYERELATDITIGAMVHGLDRPIRVLMSSNDEFGRPQCTVKRFWKGVTRDVPDITVAYNAAEGHYLGFMSDMIPQLLPPPPVTVPSQQPPTSDRQDGTGDEPRQSCSTSGADQQDRQDVEPNQPVGTGAALWSDDDSLASLDIHDVHNSTASCATSDEGIIYC